MKQIKTMGLIVIFILVALQIGCSEALKGIGSNQGQGGGSGGGEDLKFVQGSKLYAQNCAACHMVITNTNIVDTSVTATKASITSVFSMNALPSLKTLSDGELDLISYAMIKAKSDDGGGDQELTMNFNIRPLIGSRKYVESKMKVLFVNATPNAADGRITARINNQVLNQVGSFGGPCHRDDSQCGGSLTTNTAAEMLPNPNATRSGFLIRTCEEVLVEDRAVNTVLAKAGVNLTDMPSLVNMTKLFELFYPGKTPANPVLDKVAAVIGEARTKGMTDVDAWRFAMLSMCSSSLFELM